MAINASEHSGIRVLKPRKCAHTHVYPSWNNPHKIFVRPSTGEGSLIFTEHGCPGLSPVFRLSLMSFLQSMTVVFRCSTTLSKVAGTAGAAKVFLRRFPSDLSTLTSCGHDASRCSGPVSHHACVSDVSRCAERKLADQMHRDIQNHNSRVHSSIHQLALKLLWATHHEALVAQPREMWLRAHPQNRRWRPKASRALVVNTVAFCVQAKSLPQRRCCTAQRPYDRAILRRYCAAEKYF